MATEEAAMGDRPRDFPFDLMCEQAEREIRKGNTIYQKFTCAGCGTRLKMDEPNILFEEGTCDRCSTVTDIRKHGCNFLVRMMLTINAPQGDIDDEKPGEDRDRDRDHKSEGQADQG